MQPWKLFQQVLTLTLCALLAATVQAKLAAVPGVAAADVRFRERRAYVVCEPGVPDSSLTGAIQRAGPGFLAAVVTK